VSFDVIEDIELVLVAMNESMRLWVWVYVCKWVCVSVYECLWVWMWMWGSLASECQFSGLTSHIWYHMKWDTREAQMSRKRLRQNRGKIERNWRKIEKQQQHVASSERTVGATLSSWTSPNWYQSMFYSCRNRKFGRSEWMNVKEQNEGHNKVISRVMLMSMLFPTQYC
jgi:hypothetical protein